MRKKMNWKIPKLILYIEFGQRIGEGIEFLIATGSMIGLLLVIFGLLGVAFASSKQKKACFTLLFAGILLLAFCGPTYGIRYFRIRI
jgi:uncharacterized membrane protein YhaH (DUF805 family)